MKFSFACVALAGLLAFGAQAAPPKAAPAASASTAAASSTFVPPKPIVLKPTAIESEAAQLSARFLTRFHYDAQPLDNAMSEKIFKAYFKALDGNHMFFTQQDVDKFAPLRTRLDDAIWNRDLSGPYAIFNLYIQRVIGRFEYARNLVNHHTFDFNKDESFQLDRTKSAWPANMQALDVLWTKRVKNDWLRLKLAGKKPAEIRKLLDKRYEGYIDRIQQLDSQDVFQTFMDTAALTTDPHTDYFGPRRAEDFAIAMKLSLEGIGAVLQENNDYTQIRSLVAGGPAKKSGQLHVGDRIVGVAQGKDGKMVNIVGWRLDDVVQKIRGKKGTEVRLEIIPAKAGLDGKHVEVTLIRAKVTIAQSAAKKKIIKVTEGGKTHLIGVIELPSFYEDFAARSAGDPDYKSASRDVAKLLRELKKAGVSGVIVDLRNNGGGSLSEAVKLTGLFINKGPVVQVRQSDGSVEVDSDTDAGMVWAGPLAVLVNRGTASASEIFTAAIKDYGRGIVIGEPTFGKGTVQNLINLDRFGSNPNPNKPTYGELKMTIAKFFRITGGSTQLRGVTPDIAFPKNGDDKDFGEDTYDNALPWTHIKPSDYQTVANLKPLIPLLEKDHLARTAKAPAWQLLLDELAEYRKNRADTTVSLDYAKREARRKQFEALQKSFNARHKTIDGDHHDDVQVEMDDGLQPDERSLKKSLKKEKQDDTSDDVMLDEAANILADEINRIDANRQLAAEALPYGGKYTPGFGLPALKAMVGTEPVASAGPARSASVKPAAKPVAKKAAGAKH
ncbi:MAG TPA: carboxy terminal-processing peptidase [Rhodanobacteraceae bacterium]